MIEKKGLFITVEGGEGAGKTTNLSYIRQWLEQQGKTVVYTREPGGTNLGEHIRDLLLGHKHTNMAVEAELLLMFAARAQHLAQVIKPALAEGVCVLCDRFTDATYAYQGYGRGMAMDKIANLEDFVQAGLLPDLTLLLDLPVSVGMARAGKRSAPDRFELEQHSFFEAVREGYLALAKQHPERIKVIDAKQTLSQVQSQLAQTLTRYLVQ